MNKHLISLYLRRHTAKILRSWCPPNDHGIIVLRGGKVFTKAVWSEVVSTDLPKKEDYRHLDNVVKVEITQPLPALQKDRVVFAFISYEAMSRIDYFIHKLFIHQIYFHLLGMENPDRRKAVDWAMEMYQLTDADVNSESIYMAVRRLSPDFSRKHGQTEVNPMNYSLF